MVKGSCCDSIGTPLGEGVTEDIDDMADDRRDEHDFRDPSEVLSMNCSRNLSEKLNDMREVRTLKRDFLPPEPFAKLIDDKRLAVLAPHLVGVEVVASEYSSTRSSNSTEMISEIRSSVIVSMSEMRNSTTLLSISPNVMLQLRYY